MKQPFFFSHTRGFSLIEIVIFITVVGLMSSGLFVAYQQVLLGSDQARQTTIATYLAERRMELLLGQKRTAGYLYFVDPCASSPPSICTAPTGYSVSVGGLPVSSTVTEATLTVTANAPNGSSIELVTTISNY